MCSEMGRKQQARDMDAVKQQQGADQHSGKASEGKGGVLDITSRQSRSMRQACAGDVQVPQSPGPKPRVMGKAVAEQQQEQDQGRGKGRDKGSKQQQQQQQGQGIQKGAKERLKRQQQESYGDGEVVVCLAGAGGKNMQQGNQKQEQWDKEQRQQGGAKKQEDVGKKKKKHQGHLKEQQASQGLQKEQQQQQQQQQLVIEEQPAVVHGLLTPPQVPPQIALDVTWVSSSSSSPFQAHWENAAGQQVLSRTAATADTAAVAAAGGGSKESGTKKVKKVECAVCLDARADVMLLPCKHTILCGPCSQLLYAAGKPCPICCSDVEQRVTVKTSAAGATTRTSSSSTRCNKPMRRLASSSSSSGAGSWPRWPSHRVEAATNSSTRYTTAPAPPGGVPLQHSGRCTSINYQRYQRPSAAEGAGVEQLLGTGRGWLVGGGGLLVPADSLTLGVEDLLGVLLGERSAPAMRTGHTTDMTAAAAAGERPHIEVGAVLAESGAAAAEFWEILGASAVPADPQAAENHQVSLGGAAEHALPMSAATALGGVDSNHMVERVAGSGGAAGAPVAVAAEGMVLSGGQHLGDALNRQQEFERKVASVWERNRADMVRLFDQGMQRTLLQIKQLEQEYGLKAEGWGEGSHRDEGE